MLSSYTNGGYMKILNIYSSETGNTKSLAYTIKNKYNCETLDILSANEKDSSYFKKYDYIIIGFWVDKGYPDDNTKLLLSKLRDVEVILYMTLGAYTYSMQVHRCFARAGELLDETVTVLSTFAIQGRLPKEKLDEINSRPPDHPRAPTPRQTIMRNIGQSHPDEEDKNHLLNLIELTIDRTYGL